MPHQLGSDLAHRGAGRGPRDWAVDLDLGPAWDTTFVAQLPRLHTVSDLQHLTDFWTHYNAGL